MKTTIWLKEQPKKKIDYPDCFPLLSHRGKLLSIINSIKYAVRAEANYVSGELSRLEFRP